MFENIKGHNTNKKILTQFIEERKFPSSIIFYGRQGIGKAIIAKEFAKAILSLKFDNEINLFEVEEKNYDLKSNDMFDKGVHPDFLLVDYSYQAAILDERVEDQKSLKIETIREVVKFSNLKPSYSSKKVIIINDADKMTIDAQNSILKTLEEPGENTILILITSNINLILPTVISRCYCLNFTRLKDDEVMSILIEKGVELKRAELLSKLSDGSVSVAFIYNDIINIFSENYNYGKLIPYILSSKLSKSGNFREYVNNFINFVNSYAYLKFKEGMVGDDIIDMIVENFRYNKYLKSNVNSKLIFELVISKFLNKFDLFKGALL